MDKLNEILPYLLPVVLLQVGLQIWAIVNLVKRKKVRFNNKLLWGIIILLFQFVGTVAYLVFRGDEE